MIAGANRNSSRVRGCSPAAQSIDENVLRQAIQIGDRTTRRVALRNLKKLNNLKKMRTDAAFNRLTKTEVDLFA